MALRALSLGRSAALGFALAGVLTAACAQGVVPAAPAIPGLGIFASGARVTGTAAAPVGHDAPETLEELEAALAARVNADRAAHGLRPVAPDAQLLQVARARAAAQVASPALSHDDAVGPLAFHRLLREAGVSFSLAGENLARPRVRHGVSTAQLAADAERALMASETHRENVLEPRFDHLAVGVARGADGQVVFAQIFRAS